MRQIEKRDRQPCRSLFFVRFYASARDQSLDDLCGQQDEDDDDGGLYDLGAVFNGESRADEMAQNARHRADQAEDEEDLAA